jgi:hypothetical protein
MDVLGKGVLVESSYFDLHKSYSDRLARRRTEALEGKNRKED